MPHLQGQGFPRSTMCLSATRISASWCRAAAPRRGWRAERSRVAPRAQQPGRAGPHDLRYFPAGWCRPARTGPPCAAPALTSFASHYAQRPRGLAGAAGRLRRGQDAPGRRDRQLPHRRWATRPCSSSCPTCSTICGPPSAPSSETGPRRAAGRHPRAPAADPGRSGRAQQHALGAGEALPDPQPSLQRPAADGDHDAISGWRSSTRASPRASSISI